MSFILSVAFVGPLPCITIWSLETSSMCWSRNFYFSLGQVLPPGNFNSTSFYTAILSATSFFFFKLNFNFELEYNRFTVLWSFQVECKGTQPYIYTTIHFSPNSSTIEDWAVFPVLTGYLFYFFKIYLFLLTDKCFIMCVGFYYT